MDQKEIDFRNHFHTEQYNFLIKKNMELYIIDVHKGPTYIATTAKNQESHKIIRQAYPNGSTSIYSCYSKKDFIDRILYSNNRYVHCPDVNNKINFEFFIEFYQNNPQYKKTLLKDYFYYIPEFKTKEEKLFNTIEGLGINKTKKSLASFIVGFPISTWEAHTVKIDSLINYLTKNNFNNDEIDQTLFSFLKVRKNQLKHPYYSLHIREVLLERHDYKEEKLKDYFDFFPLLKAHFTTPDIDYLIELSQYDFNVRISFEKLKSSFMIDKWDTYNYEREVPNILSAMKEAYNLVECGINSIDKSSKIADILVLHNYIDYSKEKFLKDFSSFFSYLREDPNYKLSHEGIKFWFQQKILTEKINITVPIAENTVKNKNKL